MSDNPLAKYRQQLDEIDQELLTLLGKRLGICADVARYKKTSGTPMMQPGRVELVLKRAEKFAQENGYNPAFARAIYEAIIAEACRLEDEIIGGE